MLHVTLLCVGRLKEGYLREACAEYQKRLGGFCRLNVVEVEEERLPERPSQAQIDACLESEGRRLAAKVPPGALLIPLCIEGRQVSSPELSQLLSRAAVDGRSQAAFVIGGSHGIWEELKKRGELKLSMSKMTFPHQLARVMLLEQIYRAFQIAGGGKYHK